MKSPGQPGVAAASPLSSSEGESDSTDSEDGSDDEEALAGDRLATERRARRWADTGVSFPEVSREERRLIDEKLFERSFAGAGGGGGAPFSVAFSGGGVRAAAFQAGVLWRLARAGCLGDVEHFVAVSGGAYVTCAFASHLVAAIGPAEASQLDQWYRQVVAKTVCRMQRNIGYFVRDWGPGACTMPKDGSGPLPPIADIPVLVAVLVLTCICNPLTYFVVYLIPLTECVNQFMGTAMRAAYCAPKEIDAWRIFEWWGPLHYWFWNFLGLLVFTFSAWCIGKLPACRPLQHRPGQGRARAKRPSWLSRRGYLYLQSLRAATTRILVMLGLIIMVLCGIMSTELSDGVPILPGMNETRFTYCAAYVKAGGRHPLAPQQESRQCDDMRKDSSGQWRPWWEDPIFSEYHNQSGLRPGPAPTPAPGAAAGLLVVQRETRLLQLLAMPFQNQLMWSGSSLFISMILLLLSVLGVALVLTPIFKGLFLFSLSLVGPTVALLTAASFMQYRIFGPLTGQYYMRVLEVLPFSRGVYLHFRLASLVLAFIMMVFFHAIHFASHYFYTRSLRLAYFEQGKDRTWLELRENAYCPLIILTGTVTDWKRPGDEHCITEISISPLHTGSAKTGYVPTPKWRSVAKCTALAAAATDAFILGMLDRLRYRFWLEFLNLRMGDYLLFERRRNPCVAWCQRRAPPCRRESFFFYEFPVVACGGAAFVVFIAASLQSVSANEQRCQTAYHMYVFSLYTMITLFFLSFFAFVPCLEFFLHSPMIRQIHMAMRYYHQSETPPSMIYVSDGGVQDCTGILQLMRRRCARMLLALAASDPEDDLDVLRETMKMAVELKIGSFYDPQDPRRDVSMVLDEFKHNLEQTYLHLGVRYGWDQLGNPIGMDRPAAAAGGLGAELLRETGHLFVVKNRMPPDDLDLPLEPPLTEEEMAAAPQPDQQGQEQSGSLISLQSWSNLRSMMCQRRLTQRDLGGCCCDCCHIPGCHLGPQFPHVPNANQCLTPRLFSSLCRLGYRLSGHAVGRLVSSAPFEEPWERWVAS